MGNWKNRPSRRWSYNQDRRPPKSYYDPHPPYQENVDDGVPAWEKEFCYAVGAVPWDRVVDAKKFSYCQSQILKWDDLAGKEAFNNAKSRFWALINGIDCDLPRPDPDACIDEINWNPYIDPKLIMELEQECFAPVEDETDCESSKKKTRNLFSAPSEGCSMNPGDALNPWGTLQSSVTANIEGQGWGDSWDDNLKESNNLNKADNPWEEACHHGDEGANADWPVGGEDSWGWNPSSAYVTHSNNSPNGGNTWEGNREAAMSSKADGWGEFADRSWGQSQQQPRKWNNSWHPQEEGSFQASGNRKERGWRNNSGGKAWGRSQQWHVQAGETKNSSAGNPNKGRGTRNKDSWRNDGSHQYTAGYTKARYEGNEQREGGHHWRGGKAKKGVSFGYS